MSVPVTWTLLVICICLLLLKSTFSKSRVNAGDFGCYNPLKKRQSDESSSQSSSVSSKRKFREADLWRKEYKQSSRARLMYDHTQLSRAALSHDQSNTRNLIDRVGLSESPRLTHTQTQTASPGWPSTTNLDLSLGIGSAHAVPQAHASSPISSTRGNPALPSTSSSPDTTERNAQNDPKFIKPFSNDVLRHSRGKKPAGYDTKKQMIARFTERYMNKGEAKKDALRKSKDDYARRSQRKYSEWATWREIARTDPAKAREMQTQVPKRMGREDYISLRAHQLNHRGEAADMKEAIKMATEENDQQLSQKRKYNHTYVAKKQKP